MIWIHVVYFFGILIGSVAGVCEKPVKSHKVAIKTVCYPYVGCFDTRPPFGNAEGKLPKSPEDLKVTYRLHTRENPDSKERQYVDYRNSTTVTCSHFDSSKPLKFIVHGFDNTGDSPWIDPMKDALLKRGDFNILIVDWGEGAKLPDYDQSVANLRLVATEIKLLLDIMVEHGLQPRDIHLIGHSLGAHMSGYVGLLMGSKIGRISGLDPAEPDFQCLPTLIRLDVGDAVFVDVVHTNGSPFESGGAGLFQQSGHVDFYVNGGKTQPGCKDGLSGAFSAIFSEGFGAVADNIACSHARAHEIYTESITTHCPFTAFPCESYDKFTKGECMSCGQQGCSSMGYFSDKFYTQGRLFLKTDGQAPYCGSQHAVTIRTSNTTSKTKGTLFMSLQGYAGATEFVPVTPVNEQMHKDQTFSSVVVFKKNAGHLKSILLKYKKFPGYSWDFTHLSIGQPSLIVQHAQVISGESGERLEFKFGEFELKHDEETLVVTQT